jgi:hypothetical protein
MPMAQDPGGCRLNTCGIGGIVGRGSVACGRCLADAGADVHVEQQALHKLRPRQQSMRPTVADKRVAIAHINST